MSEKLIEVEVDGEDTYISIGTRDEEPETIWLQEKELRWLHSVITQVLAKDLGGVS
jgi:hypothetical protein